jgi:hypothetical protein
MTRDQASPSPPRDAREQPRQPAPIDSPVLESVWAVIPVSRHVRTDARAIAAHARWMAYEELPYPTFGLPFGLGQDYAQAVDFVLTQNCINTAFTDFATGVKFEVEFEGERWSDSMAMMACFKRAMDQGRPVLDGRYMAGLTRPDLEHVFAGTIEMPMLDEKLQILNEIGQVLADRYDGFFHNFVATCSPRLYDNGRGLVDRLVAEFPRFDDRSTYGSQEVRFYKLAQLGYWLLHAGLRRRGGFPVDDIASMTAFADYIVPAALRILDVLVYTPDLDRRISEGQEIPRDSDEEIEIRAHTVYATALLAEEINRLRPSSMQVIIPQVDARLWLSYHTTHWPHHRTRTIMY